LQGWNRVQVSKNDWTS